MPVKASLADREPVAIGAAIQSIKESLLAILAVLAGFNIWNPTIEQIGLLLALYLALAGTQAWTSSPALKPCIGAIDTADDESD